MLPRIIPALGRRPNLLNPRVRAVVLLHISSLMRINKADNEGTVMLNAGMKSISYSTEVHKRIRAKMLKGNHVSKELNFSQRCTER